MGSAIISTPIGSIKFHVVQADTSFLLCLANLDRLNVYYNKVTNSLVMKGHTISVIRRFGHPWLLWKSSLETYITELLDENPCLWTDTELRQLHRRFGHPSAARLRLLLERSGHEINKPSLDKLTKYCFYCQKHEKSPKRFKFTLRDDVNFNFTIFVYWQQPYSSRPRQSNAIPGGKMASIYVVKAHMGCSPPMLDRLLSRPARFYPSWCR